MIGSIDTDKAISQLKGNQKLYLMMLEKFEGLSLDVEMKRIAEAIDAADF